MKTFKALLKLEFILTKRELGILLSSIGIPVFFFLFFSSSFQFDDVELVAKITRNYLLSMTAFSSLSFVLFTFPYSLQGDRQENRFKRLWHSPVPMWQYYIAKMIRILVYYVIAIVAVFAIGYFFRQVRMTSVEWLQSAGLLVIGASCFIPLGLLLSYIKNAELLSVVGNFLYLGLAMIGGMWIPVSQFPEWLKAIAKWTPTYHLVELITTFLTGELAVQSLLALMTFALGTLVIALGVHRYGMKN